MRKQLLSFLLFLLPFCLNCQELPKFGELAKQQSIISTIVAIREYKAPGDYIDCSGMKSYSEQWYDDNLRFDNNTSKYKSGIIRMYRSLGYIEDVSVIKALIKPSLAMNSSQELCLLAGCYSYDVTFNTIRTDETSRAKKTAEAAVLPILQKIAPIVNEMSIPYIMIGVGYAYKDFTESYGGDGGCVVCVFKTKDALDFIDLGISQKELLEKTNVFVREGSKDMKRISF